MKLTEPQRRALKYLASVPKASPARIGEAMHHEGWRRQKNLSVQGCGRVGGTMAQRLIKMGLVLDLSLQNDGWPIYAISPHGREVLADGQ